MLWGLGLKAYAFYGRILKDCDMDCLSNIGAEVAFGKHSAVSVVIARKNYPEDEDGEPIINGIENVKDSVIFYSN